MPAPTASQRQATASTASTTAVGTRCIPTTTTLCHRLSPCPVASRAKSARNAAKNSVRTRGVQNSTRSAERSMGGSPDLGVERLAGGPVQEEAQHRERRQADQVGAPAELLPAVYPD